MDQDLWEVRDVGSIERRARGWQFGKTDAIVLVVGFSVLQTLLPSTRPCLPF